MDGVVLVVGEPEIVVAVDEDAVDYGPASVDFDMGADIAALRHELRELISEHVPPDFLGAFTDDPADLEAAQRFCKLLAERGLLCVAWPEEWGGKGASVWEQTAVREEMWAHHEPRGAQYMGVNWVGPTIIATRHPSSGFFSLGSDVSTSTAS